MAKGSGLVAGPSDKERLKWQTEDDLRTVKRACEILKDKKRMAAVKELIEEEQEALDELANYKGLRRDDMDD